MRAFSSTTGQEFFYKGFIYQKEGITLMTCPESNGTSTLPTKLFGMSVDADDAYVAIKNGSTDVITRPKQDARSLCKYR